MATTYPGTKINEGSGTTMASVLPGTSSNGEQQIVSIGDPNNGGQQLAIDSNGKASVKAGAGDITDLSTLNGKLSAARLAANGLAYATTTDVLAAHMASNGATLDLWQNNTEVQALASAARTATATSALQTNRNARGIVYFLKVTAASGTGGLSARLYTAVPVNGATSTPYLTTPVNVTATGTYLYFVYPGIGTTSLTGTVLNPTITVFSLAVPRSLLFDVVAGDSSSYTYELDYCLIL